jgi:hypothetical protein
MKIGQPKLSERVKRRLVVTPTKSDVYTISKVDDYGMKGSIASSANKAIRFARQPFAQCYLPVQANLFQK